MYLDGLKIKKLMRRLGKSHTEFAVYCNVSPSTIWDVINKEKVNTSAETSLKIYRYLKIEGLVSGPSDVLNLELINKEANNGL